MTPPQEPTLFASPPDPRRSALTVHEVTTLVKRALRDGLPAPMEVLGEISNLKVHRSGHLYFTLKDARSELSCVLWRSAAGLLKFRPADGMEVIATGEIDVFDRTGRYQLYVRRLQPTGVGALEQAFRERYDRLRREGLFDPVHKRALPKYPAHVAVITSPTGAVIRDIIQTIKRRFPCLTVSLYPVAVQGPGAAKEITAAIQCLNQMGARIGVELIIVARGGGSLEDLWAFNEEQVARAIFASHLPVISAVGHEADVTISDLVADLRAATPTAAAELAVPVRADMLEALAQQEQRLQRSTRQQVSLLERHLTALTLREALRRPIHAVQQRAQLIDRQCGRLERICADRLNTYRKRLFALDRAIGSIEPRSLLATSASRLQASDHALRVAAGSALRTRERCLNALTSELLRKSPAMYVALLHQRLQSSRRELKQRLLGGLRQRHQVLEAIERHLGAISHRRTLARGYSVTTLPKTGKLVKAPQDVHAGDTVETLTAQGSFTSRVLDRPARQGELFDQS